MPRPSDERSWIDLAAQRAVPEFFARATIVMISGVAVMLIGSSLLGHEPAPVISLALGTALAALGWKFRAFHNRRCLAGFWLFLGACAGLAILQTHSSIDSLLTGAAVICTVMATHLLQPTPARICWTVLAGALLGLYAAEQQGWITAQSPEPLPGLVMGLALLFLGMLQARFFNRAEQAASEQLLQQAHQAHAAAEEASRAKSDFLSVMSHEIRTPLNGIVGLVTLVQDERVDDANRRQYLQMLNQSSQALSNLVTGVLDFSRIEAGRLQLDPIPFSLVAWAHELENSFSASATVKGLFLQVDLDVSAGHGARGDPIRLRQIAANYISNAIKFTKAGTVRVRISRPRGDDLLRLEVRDSGIGLTETAQRQLFQPFQQASPDGQREFGGTGLGLSICERLARLMSGRVGVSSRPGIGSTFWAEVLVPIETLAGRGETGEGVSAGAAPEVPSNDVSLQAGAVLPCGRPPTRPEVPLARYDLDAARVLVVDDNAVNRTITSQMLRRMNAVVATAADGQEGVDALRTAHAEGWPFDMVLMDVQMPGVDGLTAVRWIRADPLLAGTPVVALTAGVLKEDVTRAIEAGMDGFLAKPVTAERLAHNVVHFADMGRQRRQDRSSLSF